MIKSEHGGGRYRISTISLIPFAAVTFAVTWSILGAYILFPEETTDLFGALSGQHPLFYLAVWAPALAAFSIVFQQQGVTGLRRFLGRFLEWRCSAGWYVFLIVVLPLVFYVGAAIKGTLFTNPWPFPSLGSLFAALLLSAIKGPIEEFGWRGFALPLMQRMVAPFWAGLFLGIVWGLWHLPAFAASGTQQSAWSFTPFFLGTITISLLMTALYNASNGSILLSALMHYQLMNPVWPDAQPYDTYLLVGIAVAVVWFNRRNMFSRKESGTVVISSQLTEEQFSIKGGKSISTPNAT